MKRGLKIYLLSLLYSLGVLIVASLLSYACCKYKFEQLRNPEYVRKLIDIELPAFKNVVTVEEDDGPIINDSYYSVFHSFEFTTPLSETSLQKIEQVRSKERWPHWTDEGGWGLFYTESEYQYVYIDHSALRRFKLYLSTTRARIYCEVDDYFSFTIAVLLLLLFTLWIIVMVVWGIILITVNSMRKFKLRKSR